MTPEQLLKYGIKLYRASNLVNNWLNERTEAKGYNMTVRELRNYKNDLARKSISRIRERNRIFLNTLKYVIFITGVFALIYYIFFNK